MMAKHVLSTILIMIYDIDINSAFLTTTLNIIHALHDHVNASHLRSFVGWSKGFVTGRNMAAMSLINSYTRLTFLRRMHPAMRDIYVKNLHTATFKGAMGQFLRPYHSYQKAGECTYRSTQSSHTTNVRVLQHSPTRACAETTPGCGLLHVNDTNSRNRVITSSKTPRVYQYYVNFATRHALNSPVVLERVPTRLLRINGGVRINGKIWKKGTPCFFERGPDENFGTVQSLTYWEDCFESTLFVELQRHTLNHDGIQYTVSLEPDMPNVCIFWTQLTHRCKTYNILKDGINMQAVVKVSTTRPAMDGIDFDGFL
jgi:hypothetical protein